MSKDYAIPGLDIIQGHCSYVNVTAHVKTFIQVLMTALAIGIYSPQATCVVATSDPGKSCCCTGSLICKCHPDKPCNQSCTLIQVQPLDSQIPARIMPLQSSCDSSLLCPILPTKVKYSSLLTIAYKRALNTSPPFGGSPPQASLCLWLI